MSTFWLIRGFPRPRISPRSCRLYSIARASIGIAPNVDTIVTATPAMRNISCGLHIIGTQGVAISINSNGHQAKGR